MTARGSDETQDSEAPSEAESARPAARAVAGLPAKYEDLGPIAGGAFGEVRRARDLVLDRVVAMKLLRAEHAARPPLRRRFLVEAQITAQLQHPGIVAVYERGELGDGRLWYAMKEVQGRTLQEVIEELHASSTPAGFGTSPSGWTFRRVVDAFSRVAQAMAYAHSRGVVHRDLKPANLMVGEHGEVLVMDWGLARRVGVSDPDEGALGGGWQAPVAPGLTRFGDVLGTPAYMPPEQAQGDTGQHGPASDVYSLGGVLYCVLSGRAPRRRSEADSHAAWSEGQPPPVREGVAGGPPVPDELCDIVDRAMQPAIEDRYPSAEALARDVVAWLDGVRRREQARAALEKARAVEPQIARLRAEAGETETRARVLQSDLRPFDPIDKKRPAWALEDEAARLGREAALSEATWMEAIQGALSVDPDLAEAHAMLADHHRARLIEAERAHRDEEAARSEAMLRVHDRGRHAAFLRGDGAVSLVTDPPGAEVLVERYTLQDRRLVRESAQRMGPTPLVKVPLTRGSYLLRLRAPGRVEVRYPVLIDRDGHWDGNAPGDSEPTPIVLPREGELGPNDCYVPAGWAWLGGDPEAPDSLPRRRVWVDAFVMDRFPVTAAEYLTFLNDLVANGREAEALEACPRAHLAVSGNADDLEFPRDGAGRFGLPREGGTVPWCLDWPIARLDWFSAVAYARWRSTRTGRSVRLPDEWEREKAVRGADGRLFPWGDQPEPTFARVVNTSSTEASLEGVGARSLDESPYGVRGLAGNLRDWCQNVWRHEGPRVEQGHLRLDLAAPEDLDFRAIRGGSWTGAIVESRAAARFAGRPGGRWTVVGMRLVRSYPRMGVALEK
jgi:serine/threonine protein kinase/formylglycine-generating enzyme required for sulfatase activity